MNEAPEAKNDDVFAQAFAQIAKDEAGAPATTDPNAAADPAADAGAAAAGTDPAAAAAAAVEAAAAANGADQTADGEAAQAADDGASDDETGAQDGAGDQGHADEGAILERLARLVKNAPEQPAHQQQEQQQQVQQQAPVDPFSTEEREFLTSYEKDWPDVARAEALKRRVEYQQLAGFIFNSIAKELAPIINVVGTIGERTHLSDLHSVAPDYEDVRDKVVGWVKEQPVYLQAAYNHVIQQGTVDEVADLINRWRRETGATAPAAQPSARMAAPAPAARKPDTELPTATKKAAASLAPVSSKRSAVVQQSDPSDFEAAFTEFAKSL